MIHMDGIWAKGGTKAMAKVGASGILGVMVLGAKAMGKTHGAWTRMAWTRMERATARTPMEKATARIHGEAAKTHGVAKVAILGTKAKKTRARAEASMMSGVSS